MAKEAVRIQDGEIVDYTATGAVANGDVIPLTDRVGVALGDAVAGEVVSLQLDGVFEITAATADAIAFGDVLYFDDTNRVVTTKSDSNGDGTGTPFVKAGIATSAKAANVAGTVYVKIDM